jgi:hypothetical protein
MPNYMDIPFLAVGAVKKYEPRRPVYLIEVGIDSYVVIKNESGANPRDLHFNLKAMKLASPAGAGKVLCQQELAAIDDLLKTSAYWAKQLNKPEDDDVVALRKDMMMPGTWFKMAEAKELFHLGKAMKHLKEKQDKSGVRAIAAALNRPGGLEALGQIVAIDAYNHNTDRFAPNFDGEDRWGQEWLVLVNADNVIIALDKDLQKPIGLDQFFGASEYKNVSQAIEELEPQFTEKWRGRILSKAYTEQRKRYAKEIVIDLEKALGPRNRKFAMFASQWKRLDPKAADRIFKGMSSGISALTVKLRSLVNNKSKPVPAGIESRLRILTT